MPFRVVIGSTLVEAKGYGTIEDSCILETNEKLVHDEAYVPGCDEIWDFSDCDRCEVTASGIQTLVVSSRAYPVAGRRCAIVAPSDIAFGMSRAYQTRAELSGAPFKIRVFRQRLEAALWLGLTRQDLKTG